MTTMAPIGPAWTQLDRTCAQNILLNALPTERIAAGLAGNIAALNRAAFALMSRHPKKFRTITADNRTEFHDYRSLEAATSVPFYFATPHHSWERGTNENTNGLLRQYLPKGTSLASLTQSRYDAIAETLNTGPRKRHDYQTPKTCFNVALQK